MTVHHRLTILVTKKSNPMTVSLSQLSAKASASQHNATSSKSSVNDKPLQGCDQQPDTQTNDLGT